MAWDSASQIRHGNQIHREHHLSMGILITYVGAWTTSSTCFLADDDVIGDLRSQWDHPIDLHSQEKICQKLEAITLGQSNMAMDFPLDFPLDFWMIFMDFPTKNPPLLRGWPEGNCKYQWLRRRRIMMNLPETLIYWSFRKSPYPHQPVKNEKKTYLQTNTTIV